MIRIFHRLRIAYKRWQAKRKLVIEFCQNCGREDEAWTVQDWFWLKIVGSQHGTTLCLNCFDKLCSAKGYHPIFRVSVENIPHRNQLILEWENARSRRAQ